jgi:hypothetical protein
MTPPGLLSQLTYFFQAAENSGAPEGIPDLCLRASPLVVANLALRGPLIDVVEYLGRGGTCTDASSSH